MSENEILLSIGLETVAMEHYYFSLRQMRDIESKVSTDRLNLINYKMRLINKTREINKSPPKLCLSLQDIE